jgi:hypothetical protein
MTNNEPEKYNIICLSNQLWDFPNYTNKRLVMSRIAERGNNVIFVDPPINLGRVFVRQIARGNWGLKRILTQNKVDESGALIYTPINVVPNSSATSKLHIKEINSLAKKNFDPDLKTVLWVYHVQMLDLEKYLDGIEHDILVYDCVDNYLGFPDDDKFYSTTISKRFVEKQEASLAKRADIVFATAPGLVQKLKEYNSDVYFTPNVGDYERFKNAKQLKDQIPADLEVIPRPRVGYIGALDDYKFDYDLLKQTAKDNPEYSFVIIGPMALKDREANKKELGFEGLDNVYFLGSRPYDQKQYYLAGFDVDIIPYVLNDYTVGGCFPVKFHDSMGAGLPIVVTNLPAYRPFSKDCYISKSYDEFSNNIKRAIEEDSPEKIKSRQAVAKENNWDGKVSKMLVLLQTV